ncbi:MAG: glycosyltransferase family 2 protein [Aggregatilineales bacterium]
MELRAKSTQSQRIVNPNRQYNLWLYYVLLFVITCVGIAYGYYFSDVHFPSEKAFWVETLLNLAKMCWLIPFPYAILNFYAFIRYPVFVDAPQINVKPLDVTLYFRYVTRGNNPKLIAETVEASYRILEASLSFAQWRIEVVSDNPLLLNDYEGQVEVIVVPQDFITEKGAKYKARALHYAMDVSNATDEDWVIHLDEETQFDRKTVQQIHVFVMEERRRLKHQHDSLPKIGQGVIIYGKRQIVNWLTTLADSLRVGDDYGRFRLQYEYGKANMGIHGSFIVINNGLERTIGFDHGPMSSITEDAYFALVAQNMGVKFGFIHAFMYEKSPFTIMDFIKQRHRWFGGLWLCALAPDIPLRHRYILITFMTMWSLSWLCIVMVFINLVYPTGTPAWLAIIGGISFFYYVTLYLIGFFRTFEVKDGLARFIVLMILQVVLIPVFSTMESIGVIYGLVKPPKGFYIVQKEI